MKIRSLIAVFIILTIICSFALAVSKNDLISYYRTESSSLSNSNTQNIPDEPTPNAPIAPPTPKPNSTSFPKWADMTISKPILKPSIPFSPIKKPSTELQSCPPALPWGGKLYRVGVFIDCSPEDHCMDYPIGMDALGVQYYVKPGCQCTLV